MRHSVAMATERDFRPDQEVRPPVAMATAGQAVSLALVAVLWGGSSPFLRAGAAGMEDVRGRGRLGQLLAEIRFLGLNCKYMGPFLLNQGGSLLFYLTLASTDLSLAVPLCNSLALVVTLLTGRILGEDVGGKRAVAGMLLTILGVSLCVAGSGTSRGAEPDPR